MKQTLLDAACQQAGPDTLLDIRCADTPSPMAAPQRRTTLLDVLSELDVNALRSIVGHLEAANWCCPVREACKALRAAVNTGMACVRLRIPSGEDEPLPQGRDWQSWSPLLKWPSCTKLQLAVYGRWDDREAEGEEANEEEKAGAKGMDGLGAAACDGGSGSG